MSDQHAYALLLMITMSLSIVACATSESRSANEYSSDLPPADEVDCLREPPVGSHIPRNVCGDQAQANDPQYVVGPVNRELSEGARALLAGRNEEGIRLTLLGLKAARGKKEEEIALSNLCAGYTNMGQYATALTYCDILLQRDDKNWRAYNSKALIYIHTKQYAKAEQELLKGEALNPDARSMKITRAMYLDATDPIAPEIEADDRQTGPDEPR